eukprot:symbB.v1.2.032691.t2/scaffold3956.1/size49429/4
MLWRGALSTSVHRVGRPESAFTPPRSYHHGRSGITTSRTSRVLGVVGTTSCANRLQVRQLSSRGSGMETGLVSCEWLKAELDASRPLKLVEATWYLPNSPFAAPEGSEGPQAEFMAGPRIPGAGFFDIDGVATPHSDRKLQMAAFASAAQELVTLFTAGEFGDLQRGISVLHTGLEFARLVPL